MSSSDDNAESHISFACVYEAGSGYLLPKGFNIGRFRGLESVDVVEGGDGTTEVRLIWSSRDAFEAHGSAAFNALAVSHARRCGAVTCSREHKSLWSRIVKRTGTIVSAILAIWGTGEVIRNHYADWFERPSVELAEAPTMPAAVLAGETTEFTVRAFNAASLPASGLSLRAETGRPSAPWIAGATIASPLSPRLAPGASHDFVVQVRAAALDPLEPTSVAVPVSVSGRAGEIWGWIDAVEARSREVRVWPSRYMRVTAIEPDPPTQCNVTVEVGVGRTREQGLTCAATLDTDQDAALVAVTGDSVAVTPAQKLYSPTLLQWRSTRLEAFHSVSMRLILASHAATHSAADWRTLVMKQLKVKPAEP